MVASEAKCGLKPNVRVHEKYLLWVAFITGMSIMAIETAALRLLTPYFGSSLLTWTNVIGVIMIALTVGYYWGGRIADKHTSERLLYILVLAAGSYMLLVPLLAKPIISVILKTITDHPLSIFYTSLLSILPLFVIPFIFLGMVTPYVIKLKSRQVALVGHIAGRVAACSTFGSTTGIFIPILLAMPFWGTKKTILFFALLLIVTAIIGLGKETLKPQTMYTTDTPSAL
ncbi:MAG: fused MFS/spermidine synthase [Bacteroidota bacterium]